MKLNGYIGTIDERTDWLFRDGQTEYRILIPHEASEAERFAARELTDIFYRAGIVAETRTDKGLTADPAEKFIAVGNTVYFRSLGVKLTQKEFKFDGFIIETVGNTHVIKGVGDTGTCFGVYGFAEYAMGYRYYAEDEVQVAQAGKNRIFHIKDIPTFYGRNAYSHDTTYHPDHGFRLRINGEFSTRFAKHGEGMPWSSLNDQSNAMQIMDYHKYWDDHPDWFYVIPENKNAKPPQCYPQICFSRAMLSQKEGGFRELFVKNLIENYIIPEKDKIFFMLGMSDNLSYCNCELCQKAVEKYTRSGLSIQFANMVADEVERWRQENAPEREIYLVTFAYRVTFEAPVVKQGDQFVPIDPSVVARDNVIIQYAPIDANFWYPFMDAEHNAASRESLLGWMAVARHFSVWDYRQDFNDIIFPFPYQLNAQENLKTYEEIGVMEVFHQAQRFCPGSPFIDMENFALSRLHWNGKENFDELCEEFRKAYYQEAEPAVSEYLQAIHAFWTVLREERGHTGYLYWTPSRREQANRLEELDHFQSILDRGLAAAHTIIDPDRRKKIYDRVNVLTLYPKIARLYCFPFSKSQAEMLALLEDVRQITLQHGIYYYSFWNPMKELLDECEGVLNGNIPLDQRKCHRIRHR